MEVRQLGEGAEAKVYRCAVLGIPAIAKRRIRKRYRIERIDEDLRFHRTRIEARVLASLHGKIDLPTLLIVGRDTIYMTYIEGKRLTEVSGARMKRYLRIAGTHLGTIHNNDITHGDYTPANLIAKGNRVFVIDFGLARSTTSIEDKAIDLLLMKRSVDRELYTSFLSGYRERARECRRVIRALAEIEMRGRYQSRTLSTVV